MIMRRSMSDDIRGGILDHDSAKRFFDGIGQIKESDKDQTRNLINLMATTMFINIFRMIYAVYKLKSLELKSLIILGLFGS